MASNPRWWVVDQVIQKQPFFNNMAISVGNEQRIWSTTKGKTTFDTGMMIASSSKMVSSSMFFDAVEQGVLGYDDYVTDYIDFWSKDPSEFVSKVKVRDCLTFTDGFNIGVFAGGTDPCDSQDDYATCFRKSYDLWKVNVTEQPGTKFDYNEFHLQILGTVLSNITKLSVPELLKRQLVKLNMTSSYYTPEKSPDLSSSLYTTGNDYEKFILSVWNNNIMNQTTKDTMFTVNEIYPQVTPAGDITQVLGGFVGPYSWTNWMECPFWILTKDYPNIPQRCLDAKVHSDPGIFGYWPAYDLTNEYWYQFVVKGIVIIGCVQGMFLRILVKPFLDWAVTGKLNGALPELPSDDDWQYYSDLATRIEDQIRAEEDITEVMREAYLHFIERGFLRDD